MAAIDCFPCFFRNPNIYTFAGTCSSGHIH